MHPRVAFFGWTASLGKALSIDNMRKHGLSVIDWCYMCKINGETQDHLLLHYELARILWGDIFNRFGLA